MERNDNGNGNGNEDRNGNGNDRGECEKCIAANHPYNLLWYVSIKRRVGRVALPGHANPNRAVLWLELERSIL